LKTGELVTKQQRGGTVDYLCDRVRQGILEGRFAPGQRLIARDLIEDIGTSRGPIREAFHRLEADGLVDLIPNRGASVRRLLRREVRELFQIRESLEGLAAGLAAANIDEGQNRKIFTEVWERVRPTGESLPWNVFIEHNHSYHNTIVAISNNSQLCELVGRLRLVVVMLQIGRAMKEEHTGRSHQDHVAIAEAILAGDANGAEIAMRKHVRDSHAWIQTLPDSTFKPER
jgi:DNA-binding GntR family transcriptional regulator